MQKVVFGKTVLCGICMATVLASFPIEAKAANGVAGVRMPISGMETNADEGGFLGIVADKELLLAKEVAALETGKQEEPESEYASLAIAHVDNYVNVRSIPGTDGKILGKIYNGAVANIIDWADEDREWLHVSSGSVEGYIKAEYFIYGQDAVEVIDDYVTRYAVVKAQRLNVRKAANIDSKRIGYLDNGEKAKIEENLGEWLKVEYSGGQTGYVSSEYVDTEEEFTYAISIEEERAKIAKQKELEERKRQEEAQKPENTAPAVQEPAAYSDNTELRESLVAYALQYVGNPYVNGGNSLTNGTDCSGYTSLVYANFGYGLSRTPSGQLSSNGRSVSLDEIQPGDIVCYGKSKCTHVGIYIGDGQIVHAANPRKGIVVYNVGYDNILGVKNVID